MRVETITPESQNWTNDHLYGGLSGSNKVVSSIMWTCYAFLMCTFLPPDCRSSWKVSVCGKEIKKSQRSRRTPTLSSPTMSSRNRKHTHYVYDGNGGSVTPYVQSTDYVWSIINSPWESTADKHLYSFILLSTNSLPTLLSFWRLFVVTTDGENPI